MAVKCGIGLIKGKIKIFNCRDPMQICTSLYRDRFYYCTVFGGHLVNFEIDFIVSDIFAEKVVAEVDA